MHVLITALETVNMNFAMLSLGVSNVAVIRGPQRELAVGLIQKRGRPACAPADHVFAWVTAFLYECASCALSYCTAVLQSRTGDMQTSHFCQAPQQRCVPMLHTVSIFVAVSFVLFNPVFCCTAVDLMLKPKRISLY